MDLNKMIYCRTSFRSYTGEPVDEAIIQQIKDFLTNSKPLYPDIRVRAEFVNREDVKCILPWITPQLIAIYSEDTKEALVNAGFIFQQLDLYMQSIGLGTCWLGMGRMKENEVIQTDSGSLKCVMMLAFGYPKDTALRSDITEFKRRGLEEIADRPDSRLEPARLAPSSVNSQPWYFVHAEDVLHVYCRGQGLLSAMLGHENQIDMGICLAHMYVANPDTFRFFEDGNAPKVKGFAYIGSIVIE